jgi:hypothetical protein
MILNPILIPSCNQTCNILLEILCVFASLRETKFLFRKQLGMKTLFWLSSFNWAKTLLPFAFCLLPFAFTQFLHGVSQQDLV